MLGQLLLHLIAVFLTIVIGTFSYIMFDTILDIVEEKRQAREREKVKKRE